VAVSYGGRVRQASSVCAPHMPTKPYILGVLSFMVIQTANTLLGIFPNLRPFVSKVLVIKYNF
jgi:hypothetical protein